MSPRKSASVAGSASAAGAAAASAPVNWQLLDAYMRAFRQASEKYGLSTPPGLAAALQAPGVLAPGERQEPGEAVGKVLIEAACEALGKLVVTRRAAAEKGNPEAEYQLGLLYEKGCGVEKDYAKAVHWFQKAADKNHPMALYWLGWMYSSGLGVEKDYVEAKKLYGGVKSQMQRFVSAIRGR